MNERTAAWEAVRTCVRCVACWEQCVVGADASGEGEEIGGGGLGGERQIIGRELLWAEEKEEREANGFGGARRSERRRGGWSRRRTMTDRTRDRW